MATYDQIYNFLTEYFPNYSEKGQIAETHRYMDKFYSPNLSFDDDGQITNREQWYQLCLSHPDVQDKIVPELIYVDEKQQKAGVLTKTQAIERATGKVLAEIKMHVLYSFEEDENKELKITNVFVFLESGPEKAANFLKIYGMKK